MVRQVTVPRAARALSTLPRIDYGDAFVAGTGRAQERTAEQWARTVLEGAPSAVRHALRSGWLSLGLKLGGTDSDAHILGWGIRESTADHVLLGADSRVGMPAELLVMRRKRSLLFCTFVHLGNPAARAVWAGIEPVHVPIVRRVLERAAA
jgi:hypothetical protein